MFRNYGEIFYILDPDEVLLISQENHDITKKIYRLQDYVNGFLEGPIIKIPELTEINLISKIINKFDDEHCEICLLPQGKEKLEKAKGKKGHVKCLNFLINKVLLE